MTMADLVLLGASVGLTICISRHIDITSKVPSVKVALGLSLALFSLTILEATPSSFLVVLGHDNDDSRKYLTITTAYGWLLWILSFLILVALPSAAGARLVLSLERRRVDDIDDQKYHSHMNHWILRYIGRGLRMLLAIPLIFIRVMFNMCQRRIMSRRKAEPVLVMSKGGITDGGSRHAGPQSTPARTKEHEWRSFTVGGICGVMTVIMVLWSLGSLMIQSPSSKLLPTMVSWLCAVGLLLSSVLNGFGSVSLPHSCLVGLYLEPIGPDVIVRAQVELEKASTALADKRNELTLTLSSSFSSSSDLTSIKRRTWAGSTNKKGLTEYGEEESQRRQKVQRDIEFLESLVDELTEDIADMRYSKFIGEQARTPMGKIRFYLGFVFSLILLIRLGTSFASIWRPPSEATTRRTDPITTALLWLTGHHLVRVDYNALSQFVSLLLTAFLSMSQVRMFLRTMSALNRRLLGVYRKCQCKTRRQNTNRLPQEGTQQSYADLLAALMGCYFLSCIVMTKRILPLEYRASFSRAMGDNEFVVQTAVANSAFCASAVISAVVLGMLFGIQRQNTKRHVTDDTIGSLDAC